MTGREKRQLKKECSKRRLTLPEHSGVGQDGFPLENDRRAADKKRRVEAERVTDDPSVIRCTENGIVALESEGVFHGVARGDSVSSVLFVVEESQLRACGYSAHRECSATPSASQ